MEDEVGLRVDEKNRSVLPFACCASPGGLQVSWAVLLCLSVKGLEWLNLALKHCGSLKGSTACCLGPL